MDNDETKDHSGCGSNENVDTSLHLSVSRRSDGGAGGPSSANRNTEGLRSEPGSMSLRQWLSRPGRGVHRAECLFIFSQIVEIVELAHSHGMVLQNLRPSCISVSPLGQISLNDSSASFRSSALSALDDCNGEPFIRGRSKSKALIVQVSSSKTKIEEGLEGSKIKDEKAHHHEYDHSHSHFQHIAQLERYWYASPEEPVEASCSFSSNVYALGVMFFELFCNFSSEAEQLRVMSDLGHRISPTQLLQKWPKELAFCIWLLHPKQICRPKLSEVLQSEIIMEGRHILEEWKMAQLLEEEIVERDLLLDFLFHVQQRKEETSEKLCSALTCIKTDINEIRKQQFDLKQKCSISLGLSIGQKSDSGKAVMSTKQIEQKDTRCNATSGRSVGKSTSKMERRNDIAFKSVRVLRNFKELERFYFSVKPKNKNVQINSSSRPLYKSSSISENVVGKSPADRRMSAESNNDGLAYFFGSLCKYLRFSKFQVKATLRQGDMLNSSSLVCSLSFDRDKEYLATAGFNKKIKIFEYATVLNENLDIHYPVTEMSSSSQLTGICWNNYIKSHIASSAFDGIVQLWDTTRNQPVISFQEHQRRVWSVDFSQTDPTKLASGGDDCNVKLWSISQERSIGTIQAQANVCCVQFPPDSAWLLAFGTADYQVYCYDLRNTKLPCHTLSSHNRAVSNIRFLDSSNLVSASTDNTLKLWDLSKSTGGITCNPVLTYSGHRNEKNFVGLSVADGYIATGSESNEVVVYHRSMPIPVASFKFSFVDPVNGQEVDDDDAVGQFVSSVCWRGSSQTLVAANCKGNLKILEMV